MPNQGASDGKQIDSNVLKSGLFIPFGSYQKGKRYVPPLNQVLVGREGERGYLLKLLRQPSERSAVLITGRRGSGKSSFVNSCLQEFDNDIGNRWQPNEPHFTLINKVLLNGTALILLLLPATILLVTVPRLYLYTRDGAALVLSLWPPILVSILFANMIVLLWARSVRKSKNTQENAYGKFFPNKSAHENHNLDCTKKLDQLSIEVSKILSRLYWSSGISIFIALFSIIGILCFGYFWSSYSVPIGLSPLLDSLVNTTLTLTNQNSLSRLGVPKASLVIISAVVFISSFFSLWQLRKDLYLSIELRDFLKEVRGRSLDGPTQRRLNALSNMTITGRVIRYFYPVYKVVVNLGFDRLDHNQVVHAMLSSLRDEMLNKTYDFISLPRMLQALTITILIVISAAIVNYLFGFFDVTSNFIFFGILPILFILSLTFLMNKILRFLEKRSLRIHKIESLLKQLTMSETRSTSAGGEFGLPWAWLKNSANRQSSVSYKRDAPIDPRLVELKIIRLLREIRRGFLVSHFIPGFIRKLRKPFLIFVFDELDKLGFSESAEEAELSTIERLPQNNNSNQLPGRDRAHIRTAKINLLLSDMKNMITTGPARYIFIGGPELHDLWLADEMAREPFFTSIFDSHIHLKSLLTDQPVYKNELTLSARIREFVSYQYRRANFLLRISRTYPSIKYREKGQETTKCENKGQDSNGDTNNFKERIPRKFAIASRSNLRPDVEPLEADFTHIYKNAEERDSYVDYWMGELFSPVNQAIDDQERQGRIGRVAQYKAAEYLMEQVIGYLTFRSGGNPKKLVALFENIVRQRAKLPDASEFDCESILKFSEKEIYRIQLLNCIFIHLARHFTIDIGRRDDKLGPSIFYLVDFILKFHGQAFSWRTLYRLDEYVILYRVPDLDYIYERLVRVLSLTHLEKIPNGLYSYRFKSGFSKELKYISRISRNEMASFNFTLDESKELKQIYIRQLAVPGNENNIEIIVALGELYDFDHEFDMARGQFRVAIGLLDDKFEQRHGRYSVRQVKLGTNLGDKLLKKDVTWGLERLRLLMQLAMTFERDKKVRSSIAIYQDAQTLAHRILVAYTRRTQNDELSELTTPTFTRLDLLKQYRIIFLPLFCKAWAIEKHRESVQNSIAILAAAIDRIKQELPFSRRDGLLNLAFRENPERNHANFALIVAQLHDRFGDLAFYKGDRNDLENRFPGEEFLRADKKFGKTNGYLRVAQFQYLQAIDYLMAFVKRKEYLDENELAGSDKQELSDVVDLDVSSHVKIEFAHVLADLSDTLIGMTDIHLLFLEIRSIQCDFKAKSSDFDVVDVDIKEQIKRYYNEFEAYLFRGHRSASNIPPETDINRAFQFPKALSHLPEQGIGNVQEWLELKSRDFDGSSIEGVLDKQIFKREFSKFTTGLINARVAAELRVKTGDFATAAEEIHSISNLVLNVALFRLLRNERTADVLKHARFSNRERLSDKEKLCFKYFRKDDVAELSFIAFLLSFCFENLSRAKEVLAFHEAVNRPSEARELLFGHISSFILYDSLLLQAVISTYLNRVKIAPAFRRRVFIRFSISSVLETLATKNKALISELRYFGKSTEPRSDFEFKGVGGYKAEIDELQTYLKKCLLLFRYPLVARLKGYRGIIYMSLLKNAIAKSGYLNSTSEIRDLVKLAGHMDELHRLYDAPFHNTPTEHGICLSAFFLFIDKGMMNDEELGRNITLIGDRAKYYYSQAKQMHTMGDYYYESIQSMYFAYEDFNDRNAHRSHAVQMLMASVFHEFRTLIRRSDRIDSESRNE